MSTQGIHEIVPIQRIRVDQGTQTRKFMRPDIVNDYAEEMQYGKEFPELVCFDTGEMLVLVDGFHRLEAMNRNKFTEAKVIIHSGSLVSALIFAAGANSTHGMRRTREDKINAVSMLLANPEIASQSNRAIADMADVSDPFVGTVRELIAPKAPETANDSTTATTEQPAETRTGKDGKKRAVKKRKKKKAAERQPGDDTPNADPNAPAQGEAAFDLKRFNMDVGTVARHLDRIARDFGLVHPKSNTIKETLEHKAIRRKLEEIQKDVVDWRSKLHKEKKDAAKAAKATA